jgi:diguanylate cyclase (GGDEF)-like protein
MLFSAILIAAIAFQRVPVPDDVPAHISSAIAQDHQGLLWIGTQGGLVRYDGHAFRVYRSNPSDPATLGGNYVRSLLVASDGRLWVGTFSGGLSVFDPATERFTRYDRRAIAYDRVEGLAEDRSGRIWVATTAGLDRLDPRSGRVDHISAERVRGLLVDRRGGLWVGTRHGLQRWLGEGRGFENVAPELDEHVLRLFEDRRGRIWIGTEESGAAVFDPASKSVRRLLPRPRDPAGLSHFWVYGFAEGATGEIWVATFGGGIDVVDEQTLAVVHRLRNDPTLPDTIGADRVGALFRDRDGTLWVGTWGEGLARHDVRTRAFEALRFSPGRPDGLTHRAVVRAVEMRDGTIWAGTNGNGIDVLDTQLRRVAAFRADADDPGALSDGGITCIAQSADGTAWVATLDGGLHRLQSGSKRFDRLSSRDLPGGPIRTIASDRDGNVWAGAAEGLVRVDPRTLATRVFRQWPGAANASPAIEAVVVAADGALWVGTDNGLYSFDPRSGRAVHIGKDPARAEGLPDNWVPDLMLARDGRLWAGTAAGVCVLTHWDGKTARFSRLTSSAAEALVEDQRGHVWVGPRLRIDPESGSQREFGPADGVAFRNFFIASRARTRDGRLLFGSPEGLLVVDAARAGSETESPSIVPTALRVEGRERPGASVLRFLELSPSERSFTLDVAALDFADAAARKYRYRMEGLDRQWTVMGPSQRSIALSRLPPGTYVLRVGVTDRSGQWGAGELRLPVRVRPAFHETAWFRGLLAAAALVLLYALYRLRVSQLRAQRRRLEALVAERTSELKAAYARIEEASVTDPLTGLRNRRYLEQVIGADVELAGRGHGDLIVLLADLDHFKSVNDTYGHPAGDAVLVEMAGLLRETFRASDHLVRWGGEEFLIVVRFTPRVHASELAEKLRVAVERHPFVLPDGTILQRTCSIGYAAWPSPGTPTFDRAIAVADSALYAAKQSGRNAVMG